MKLEMRIYFFYKWRVQNGLNYICCNLWIDFLCVRISSYSSIISFETHNVYTPNLNPFQTLKYFPRLDREAIRQLVSRTIRFTIKFTYTLSLNAR